MKVSFVQTFIDFVAHTKQLVTGCVASKVVAGLEPNKTDELLSLLGCQYVLPSLGTILTNGFTSVAREGPETGIGGYFVFGAGSNLYLIITFARPSLASVKLNRIPMQ